MKHVAVGILMRDGHVLACQRKRDARYPLKWEFPGGKLEPEETAQQALIRELYEELFIEPVSYDQFYIQDWVYAEGVKDPGKEGAFRVTYYIIHTFKGEPVNNAFEKIDWVTPSRLLTMDILEGNRSAVRLLVDRVGKRDAAND